MASHADRETNCMPELITLRNEHARLLTELATLRIHLAEAQASERERAAKVRVDYPDDDPSLTGSDEDTNAYWAGVRETRKAIRSLSPTPNQEKPE